MDRARPIGDLVLGILRRLARPMHEERDISVAAFMACLADAGSIDISAIEFHSASGAGRYGIRRAIEAALGQPPLGRPKVLL